MTAPIDFSGYLRSLVDTYSLQQDFYTLTDLQVEIRAESLSSPEQPQAKREIERSPVLAGLRKYVQKGHVVLVGKPGSGKSTALQRLRWELAQAALEDETQPIPVLVALRSDRSIPEAICAELRRVRLRVTLEQIDDWLMSERLFLLLDGLNEIPSQEREHQVDQFRKDNFQARMIFTSRELGTELGIKQKLEMCGLTEQQMRSFVKKYLPDYADQLLQQLKDRLRELAETPLLLKLLCEVFNPETQQIPHSKGELFRAVDRKYNIWKTGEGARTSEKFWQWNQELLSHLAFGMLQADGSPTGKWLQVDRPKAEQMLERFLQGRVTAPGEKARDWLQDLLDHHLLQLAANPNQIEFRHQLFQEYYAAEYLLRQLETLSDAHLKRDYLNLLKWTEPLAMMVALITDKTKAVRLVELALEVDWSLGARLAGEVQLPFQENTVALLDPLKLLKQWKFGFISFRHKVKTPAWLKVRLLEETRSESAIPRLLQALDDQDSDVRRRAVWALGNLGSEQAISRLLQALYDQDSRVCSRATKTLGDLGSDKAIPGLLRALDDQDFSVRWNAAEALSKLGSDEAIPELLRALDNQDFSLRRRAAEALGKLDSDKAIPGLLQALHDQDFSVHWGAAGALAKLGSDKAIPGLLQALHNQDSSVRRRAAEALGRLGSDKAIPGLLQALHDQDSSVRWNAAEALSKLGSEKAIPGLLQALQDQDFFVRLRAAEALGTLGSEEGILALLQALHDRSSSFIRQRAAEALGKLDSDKVIPGLLRALDDQDFSVHWSAAKALAKLSSEKAIPALLQALHDRSSSSMRQRAAEALGKLSSEKAIPGLLQALHDQDASVRWSAAKALGTLGSDKVVPALLQALHDQNNFVRLNAAKALAKLGSEEGVLALLQALHDQNNFMRLDAAEALAKLGSEEGVPALLQALHAQDASVRLSAAWALADLGSDKAVPELLQALDDQDAFVRWRAAWALADLGSDKAIPELLQALDDQDDLKRFSAVDALADLSSDKAIPGLLQAMHDLNFFVCWRAAEALGKLGSDKAISALLQVLHDQDSSVHWNAAEVFGNLKGDRAARILPNLLILIPTPSGEAAFPVLTAIQANCQFYNYEIFSSDPLPESRGHLSDVSSTVYIDSVKELTLMSEQAPIFNQQGAAIGVNYAAAGSNPKVIQNIQNSQQASPEAALHAVVEVIRALEKKYSLVQDEQQALSIIDAKFKEIKAKQLPQWQDLMNVKRLWNGGKKASVKIGEHFAENNVWAKGAIAFLEGVNEDVK